MEHRHKRFELPRLSSSSSSSSSEDDDEDEEERQRALLFQTKRSVNDTSIVADTDEEAFREMTSACHFQRALTSIEKTRHVRETRKVRLARTYLSLDIDMYVAEGYRIHVSQRLGCLATYAFCPMKQTTVYIQILSRQ